MKILVKLAILITVLISPAAFSWNALGHMVIANIAYQNLKPDAREKIDKMVAYLHSEYPNHGTYELLTTWPDSIRAIRIYPYSHWHYIAIGFSKDGTVLKNKIDTDNAVWALTTIKPVIKNDRANYYERARFLAFFSHIVSDVHQPLHTVTYFSAKKPNGDLGGNTYYVVYQNKRMSLHQLWDEGVGIFEGNASSDNVDIITAKLVSTYPKDRFGNKVNDFNFNNWTAEGMSIANEYTYAVDEETVPSPGYLDAGKTICEQQAALAGYRLGNLLNELLSTR